MVGRGAGGKGSVWGCATVGVEILRMHFCYKIGLYNLTTVIEVCIIFDIKKNIITIT